MTEEKRRRWPWIVAVALVSLGIGCEKAEDRALVDRKQAASWVGMPIEEVFIRRGTPDGDTMLNDGTRVLMYRLTYFTQHGGTETIWKQDLFVVGGSVAFVRWESYNLGTLEKVGIVEATNR